MQHRHQEELNMCSFKNKIGGIRSMNTKVYQHMHEVETNEEHLNEDLYQNGEMDQRSAELYDILCQHCAGDALRIVRGVADMRGFEAWQTLF